MQHLRANVVQADDPVDLEVKKRMEAGDVTFGVTRTQVEDTGGGEVVDQVW